MSSLLNFFFYFFLKFSSDPGAPSSICEDCFGNLNIVCKFKRDCEESENRLQSLLNAQYDFFDGVQPVVTTKSNGDVIENSQCSNLKVEFCESSFGEECLIDETCTLTNDSNLTTSYATIIANTNENSIEMQKKKRLYRVKKSSHEKNPKQLEPLKKSLKLIKNKADLSKINAFEESDKKILKQPKLKVPEQCPDCGKLFNYSGYLETHMR